MLMIIDVFFLTCISGCSKEQQSHTQDTFVAIQAKKHIDMESYTTPYIRNNYPSYLGIGQARGTAHVIQQQINPIQQQIIYDAHIQTMSIYELLNQYRRAKTTRYE